MTNHERGRGRVLPEGRTIRPRPVNHDDRIPVVWLHKPANGAEPLDPALRQFLLVQEQQLAQSSLGDVGAEEVSRVMTCGPAMAVWATGFRQSTWLPRPARPRPPPLVPLPPPRHC